MEERELKLLCNKEQSDLLLSFERKKHLSYIAFINLPAPKLCYTVRLKKNIYIPFLGPMRRKHRQYIVEENKTIFPL